MNTEAASNVRSFVLFVALVAVACGGPSPPASASPTPDASHAYQALIHSYYTKYEAAKGDALDYCVGRTDPAKCAERGTAMIAVWESLLSDLDATPAPPKFKADDASIRKQLPKGIDDLKKMVAAATAGDENAMASAGGAYIDDMVPIVSDALRDIDPIWPKE